MPMHLHICIIATILMVKEVILKHDYQARILTVSWAVREHLPYSYKLLLNCYLLDNDTCTQYRNTHYSLTSTTVNAAFDRILENSKCTVNLLAEYNPASIDPGLDKTLLITIPATSKYVYIVYTTL